MQTITSAPVYARFGYVIATTEGLIEEGSRALSGSELIRDFDAKEINRGHSGLDEPHGPVAVFRSRQEAEAVMHAITPANHDPACYAGLSVESAWQCCPRMLAMGHVAGQRGFAVPEMDLIAIP